MATKRKYSIPEITIVNIHSSSIIMSSPNRDLPVSQQEVETTDVQYAKSIGSLWGDR